MSPHAFVDEHSLEVAAPVPVVWEALHDWAPGLVGTSPRHPVALALGTDPPGGFAVTQTFADFPGPHGAAYRLLVVRSGLHVVATRRLLRQIAARAVSRR